MKLVLLLGLSGAAGTLARYSIGVLAQRWYGAGFPWGTLAVNLLGCFAIGVLMAGVTAGTLHRDARALGAIGFLGAFTTFSAFGYETIALAQAGSMRLAAFNVVANLLLGLTLVVAGLATGRALLGP